MTRVGAIALAAILVAGACSVRANNPNTIHGLADLARPGLRVVLAAPVVPAGAYAQDVLAKARVTVKPVSLEDNVEGVVTKIALGEAEAGIVYATDATPARHVDAVTIPARENVSAQYLAAGLSAGGQQFVSFLLSSRGQGVLRRFGFQPAPQQ